MKVTESLKQKIKNSIEGNMYPPHCFGCDEWGCGGYDGFDGESHIKRTVESIVKILELEGGNND